MAILTSLENVVSAIVGAVMSAQHMVEKAQVANIASFFNDQHQPTVIELNLPAIHSNAESGTRCQYSLPLLTLVAHSSLAIGEAEIDLDLELGAFEQLEPPNQHHSFLRHSGRAAPSGKKPVLMVNASTGGIASKSGNAAHLKLKLQAQDKSEGLARLLNDVVQGQGLNGIYTTPASPQAAEPPPSPAPATPEPDAQNGAADAPQ